MDIAALIISLFAVAATAILNFLRFRREDENARLANLYTKIDKKAEYYEKQISSAESRGDKNEESRLRKEYEEHLESSRARTELLALLRPNNQQAIDQKISLTTLSSKKLEEVLNKLESIPQTDMSAEEHFERANAYYATRQFSSALEEYSESIRLDPRKSAPYANRGNTYAALWKNPQAIADYTNAIRLNGKFAIAYANRGEVFSRMGERDIALTNLNRAIKLDSNLSSAFNSRGNIRLNENSLGLALEDFDKAIELNPEHAIAYSNRGSVYVHQNDTDRALNEFEISIAIDPNLSFPYANRANLCFTLGDIDAAISDASIAIELQPPLSAPFATRAGAFLGKGEFELALKDCESAINIDDKDPIAHYNKACAYSRLENLTGCLDSLRTSIDLSPLSKELGQNDEDLNWARQHADIRYLLEN